MNFKDWIHTNKHCWHSQKWFDALPEQTLECAWESCERGDWMLDALRKAGVKFDVLAPVVYAAVNRAMKYAGVETVKVFDSDTALIASSAAAAYDADAAAYAADAAAAAAAAYAATRDKSKLKILKYGMKLLGEERGL